MPKTLGPDCAPDGRRRAKLPGSDLNDLITTRRVGVGSRCWAENSDCRRNDTRQGLPTEMGLSLRTLRN
jgi:hypothetical protein